MVVVMQTWLPLLVDLYTIPCFSRDKIIAMGKKYVCIDMHYVDRQTDSKPTQMTSFMNYIYQ